MTAAACPTGPEPQVPGRHSGLNPDLDIQVPERGYAWWYVDALSDDGAHGLTLIAFIGSVFSPYYFKGRRRGDHDPRNYVSLNVCLYGRHRRWAMTERGAGALHQDARSLRIGPSAVRWHTDETLSVHIDEVGAPLPRPVRGEVRVIPELINEQRFTLDAAGKHRWQPVAPSARVEVALESPALRWSGHAYFDRNWGDEPIEDGFTSWDWSRASLGGSESAILYNIRRRDGSPLSLALRFGADGSLDQFDPPPNHRLPPTSIWRIPRGSQADPSGPPRVLRTLEDTPFYSRSVIDTRVLGRPAQAMHESLSLERFRSPVVQYMLTYRMPRR